MNRKILLFLFCINLLPIILYGQELRVLSHYKISCIYMDILHKEFGDSLLREFLLKTSERKDPKFLMVRYNFISKYDLYDIEIIDTDNLLSNNVNQKRFIEALKRQPYLYVYPDNDGFIQDSYMGQSTYIVSARWLYDSWKKEFSSNGQDLFEYSLEYITDGIKEVEKYWQSTSSGYSDILIKKKPIHSEFRHTNSDELVYYQIYNTLLKTLPDEKLLEFINGNPLGTLLVLHMIDKNVSGSTFIISDTHRTILNDAERLAISDSINSLPYKYYTLKDNQNKLQDSNSVLKFITINNRYIKNKFRDSQENTEISLVEFAKEYIPKRYAELELEWECKENNKQNSQNDIVSKTGNNIGFAGITIIQIFILLVIVIIVCGGILFYKKIRKNKA